MLPTRRTLTLLCAPLLLGLLPLAAPIVRADDEDDPQGEEEKEEPKADEPKPADDGKPKKREVDTDSPEAQALKEMLHVDPNYGKDDKKVELTYLFTEQALLEDWEQQGFDRCEVNSRLELGVGSQRQGLMLHNLNLKGDWEIEVDAAIDWIAPSSQLVFVFGSGKCGALYGSALGKRGSDGYKPLSRKAPILRERYQAARMVKLKFVCKSGEVTTYLDGSKTDSTHKLSKTLDGRFGFFLTNMRLSISRVVIRGEVDTSKL